MKTEDEAERQTLDYMEILHEEGMTWTEIAKHMKERSGKK